VNGPERSDLQQKMARGENPLQLHSRRDLDRILGLVIHRPPYVPLLVKYLVLAEHRRYGALLNHIFSQIIGDALERPLDDRLGELDLPTIIFWGEQDQLLHVSAATFQNERIAGSELVIFENVGHVPMIERPWATAQHHRDSLARTTPSATEGAA
jgi:pimeloyl-ACP methyl ester carboxylesterase